MKAQHVGYKRILAVIATVFLLAGPAVASAASVRLHNQDSRTWKLYVKHKGSAVHSAIGPRTVTNICSGPCTIQIKDTGASISARPGELIIIRGGKLSKR